MLPCKSGCQPVGLIGKAAGVEHFKRVHMRCDCQELLVSPFWAAGLVKRVRYADHGPLGAQPGNRVHRFQPAGDKLGHKIAEQFALGGLDFLAHNHPIWGQGLGFQRASDAVVIRDGHPVNPNPFAMVKQFLRPNEAVLRSAGVQMQFHTHPGFVFRIHGVKYSRPGDSFQACVGCVRTLNFWSIISRGKCPKV